MKIKLTWVPNTLTLGNLTLGFVSMLVASEAMKSNPKCHEMYALSGVLIILAALFDGFDGMAARALNATSELGADLDSLADLTTFGIAPGFLTYKMFLEELKVDLFFSADPFPIGMLIAALYPCCAAFRLARFNVAHDPKSFLGLPSPVAGVVVGFFPIVLHYNQVPVSWITIFFSISALLMVSTIKYSKPQVAMRGLFSWKKVAIALGGLTILLALVSAHLWPWFLYGMVFFYIFSGLVAFVINAIQEI